MRVVGEVAHPRFKITIFQMGNRFSLQVEDGFLVQIYKIPVSDIMETPQHIEQWINPSFLERTTDLFKIMSENAELTMQPFLTTAIGEETFPVII